MTQLYRCALCDRELDEDPEREGAVCDECWEKLDETDPPAEERS